MNGVFQLCEGCNAIATRERYCKVCRDLGQYFDERELELAGERSSFDELPRTDVGVMEIPEAIEKASQVAALVVVLVVVSGVLGLAAIGAIDVIHRFAR